MDKDTALRLLRSWLLGWTLSLGGCLCLAGCFRLNIPRGLVLQSCLLALGATGIMVLPRVRKLLLPLGALAVGYCSRLTQVRAQFLGLGRQILEVFHEAYGWQVPDLSPVSRECGVPLGLLVLALALGVGRTVCRRKSALFPLLLAGSILALCAMAPDPEPPVWALFLLLEAMGILLFTGQVRQQTPSREARLGGVSALVLGFFLAVLLFGTPKNSYVNRSEALRQRLSHAVGLLPGDPGSAFLSLLLRNAPAAPQQLSLEDLGPREPGTAPVLTVTSQSRGPLYLRQRDYDCYDGRFWTASPRRTEQLTPTSTGEPVLLQTREPEPLLLLPQPCSDALTLTGGAVENPAGITEYTLLRGEASVEPPPETCLELPNQTRAELEDRFPQIRTPQDVRELLSGGHYTLSPEEFPAEAADFALWFLGSGMEGYCLHFAATTAVLLRRCGLPARLVTGYLVETEPGIPITVTESHAHAWAEYYDEAGRCWRLLDTTPSASQTVPETIAPRGPAAETVSQHQKAAPGHLLWAGIALLPLPAGTLCRYLRHRRMHRGSTNAQALARWRETQRLARLLGEAPHQELHVLAQKARFSPHLLTEEELREFDSYLRSCHVRLGKKSFAKRLVLGCFFGVY